MPAKMIAYDVEARKALEAGVNAVANAVKVTSTQGSQRRPRP